MPVLTLSRRAFAFAMEVFAHAGYPGEGSATATIFDGEIVRKPPGQVGITVHPRGWGLERFFAWISRNRL